MSKIRNSYNSFFVILVILVKYFIPFASDKATTLLGSPYHSSYLAKKLFIKSSFWLKLYTDHPRHVFLQKWLSGNDSEWSSSRGKIIGARKSITETCSGMFVFLPVCLHFKMIARLFGSCLGDCVQGVACIRFGTRFFVFCNILRLWLRAAAIRGTRLWSFHKWF